VGGRGGHTTSFIMDLMKTRKLDFLSSFNNSYQITLQLWNETSHLNESPETLYICCYCNIECVNIGPRRDEITGEWRRLHNEELNDLYSSPNIVRVIKSRRMRWDGHVARMGEERGVYRVLVGKPEGSNYWGDLGVDGWIILRRISRRWDVGIWTVLVWPRIETGGGRL